jgi:hypothetical protein
LRAGRELFKTLGMAGLEPRHKGSELRTVTPAGQARVPRKKTQKPNDGSTHWSCRNIAAVAGVSRPTVKRISAQAVVQPHRLEHHMAGNDPDVVTKGADIIGLYK